MSEEKKDTFCPLPWNHLATHPDGMVSLCCKADTAGLTDFSRTSYPNFDANWRLGKVMLPVIVNGETFNQTRLDMLAGKEPIACKGCYAVEKNGGRSKRQGERAKWPNLTKDKALGITDNRGMIEARYEFIELRLGNKCNLKCATCNPVSSNQWYSDYDSIAKDFLWVDQKMTTSTLSLQYSWPNTSYWVEDPKFWEELYKFSPTCKKIYINGGEPMLNLEHIEFLKRFVRDGRSKEIELVYSTNVTSIPKDIMHEVWANFKTVEINASVDHVGYKNTLIRYPSSWEKIERTLLELKEISSINLTVIQTISAYNFLDLLEFSQWINDIGVKWWVNYVDSPDYLSVLAIPVKVRLAKLAEYAGKLPSHIYGDIYGRYAMNEVFLDYDKFVQFNNKLDQLRGTKWRETLPSLSEVFV